MPAPVIAAGVVAAGAASSAAASGAAAGSAAAGAASAAGAATSAGAAGAASGTGAAISGTRAAGVAGSQAARTAAPRAASGAQRGRGVVRQSRTTSIQPRNRIADEMVQEAEETGEEKIIRQARRGAEKIQQSIEENEESSGEGEDGKPLDVPFPIFALFFAVTTDALDALSLTGAGFVLSLILQVIIGFFLLGWYYIRCGTGAAAKHMGGQFHWFLLKMGIEFIPLVDVFPGTTLAVWGAYKHLKESSRR